jgi:hypothetical protein
MGILKRVEVYMAELDIGSIGSAIAAIGALGTAAYGLLDATKAFGGGVSRIGWGKVQAALLPFQAALADVNADWTATVRANWLNGVAKEDQKAAAKSLVRLGLSPANAAALAPAGRVDPARLVAVMTAVDQGNALVPADVAVLARFDSAVDAALDAGFERADQRYRNVARLLAGIIAVALAVVAAIAFPQYFPEGASRAAQLSKAALIGLIAVPLAPIAKDLSSALSTAASALKAAKR